MSLDMTRKGDLDRCPTRGMIRYMVMYRNKDKYRLEAEHRLPRRLRTPKEESRKPVSFKKAKARAFKQCRAAMRSLANK